MILFGKTINKYYKKFWYLFLIGILALVAVDIFHVFIPEKLGQIVNLFEEVGKGIKTFDDIRSEVISISIYVVIVAAGLFLGRLVFRYTIFYASKAIEAGIREEMFDKAETLSEKYYHENKVGNIISWFTTDLENIEEFLGWGTVMLVDATFLSILVIVKMFMSNWFLSMITMIPIALIIVWGALVEKYMQSIWMKRQEETDRLYDFSQENFTGIRVIKAFVKENQQLRAFSKVAIRNKDVNIKFARLSVLFDVFIEIIIAIITAIIFGVGGWLVYETATSGQIVVFGQTISLTAGTLVTFLGYFDTLIWPMMSLGQIFTMKSRSSGSLTRINNFLYSDVDVKDSLDATPLHDVSGEIKFDHLTFIYPHKQRNYLDDFTCTIHAGEHIGVVGRIGSGKSTMTNVLLRLYNVEDKKIFIDGQDIMHVTLKSLRDNIAMVPQDSFLFADKISTNISFSNEDISQEEIEKAAKLACVSGDIEKFDKKYDTITGERGTTLSGGQKQRIAIARAFIKDAPILILDDSVSAVDTKTEETLLKNIKKIREGKTTIIIASRISTVEKLDRIMVLDRGKLEAFDTHANLINISPTYQKMNYLQTLEKEVEGGKN